MRYKMMVEVRSFWLAFHTHEIRSKWSLLTLISISYPS